MTVASLPVSEDKLVQHSREFPWGVEVCSLKHPKTGELLPGKLPTSPGGIIISCDAQREKEATASGRDNYPRDVRAAARYWGTPDYRTFLSFRLALAPGHQWVRRGGR